MLLSLLRLRYRVRAVGVEQISKITTPILFLFEHPARHDSFFQFTILAALKNEMTGDPMLPAYVAEGDVVINPSIQRLCKSKLMTFPKVFPSPFATAPEERTRQAEKLINDVISYLKSGRHVALSPTGMLMRADGATIMKKKYGTSRILQAFQAGELTVVATKFTGLFGSVWSRALNGELAAGPLIKKVMWSFLKGGVIFSCRRDITVSFETCALPMGNEATLESVNCAIESVFSTKHVGKFVAYNFFDKKTLRELSLELEKT